MFYKRKIVDKIESHLKKDETTVITGPRQSGKTTILKYFKAQYESKGYKTYFINLENTRYLHILNKSPLNIYKLFNEPNNNEKVYLFIDEIQYLNNPSNFLKLLYDEYAGRLKICVSGSSAFYIDRKFKDSLVVRKRIFLLGTVSFEDFLIFKNREDLLNHIPCKKFEDVDIFKGIPVLPAEDIEKLYREYMLFGGYPAVVKADNTEEKIIILDDIITSYIKKDMYESGVRKAEKFFDLMRILAAQTGCSVNLNELSNTLRISHNAIDNYVSILEKSFHISQIRPFTGNIRSEISKMPKLYYNDTGIRNMLLDKITPDSVLNDGALLENAAYKHLSKRFSTIHFWRTRSGSEVDFILPEEKLAFEVKINPSKFKARSFIKNYSDFDLYIISLSLHRAYGEKITAIPVWYI